MISIESRHSNSVHFGGLNPPDRKKTNWKPQGPPQKKGFRKFFSSILSDVEKSLISMVKLFMVTRLNKKFDVFRHFDTIHQWDRQTDTGRRLVSRFALRRAIMGVPDPKNENHSMY